MPTPYEETGWAPIGPPQSPIVAARQAQQAEPPDPSEFFHVGPGVPADDPTYKQDRDNWWQNYVEGFYQQNFRNVNDYIEFVQRLPSHPGIDAFAKKQAEKYMPPKLKEELEAMKAEKKQKKAFEDAFETVQKLNKDPRMRKLNQVAELDPKGGIKFTELKIDPEFEPYNKQIEVAQQIIKTLNDKSKGEEDKLNEVEKKMLKAMYRNVLIAQDTIRQKLMARESDAGAQEAQAPEQEAQTPQSVLQAYREGRMTKAEAMAIGQRMGWK